MRVPFVDLKRQVRVIQDEIDAAIAAVVGEAAFIGGRAVADFERDLALFMESEFAQGVASGTAALTITLRALGLGSEDEVIVPVHTAVPTAEAVVLAGARVVFADIDEGTGLIDPQSVEERITPRTRALVVVHLYGLCAPMEELGAIATRHGLALIEDVAQAQGARYHGQRVGSLGRAGCLSFFPSKNLGGFGDGGAVVTDSADIHTFVSMYCNHGRKEKLVHELIGANERLDGLQAAVLRAKLRHLDAWNARRRQVAAWYEEALAGFDGVLLPTPLPDTEPVWHLYVVRVEDRDALRAWLAERGIATGLHYPMPLHRQPAFAFCDHGPGDFPVAERVTASILSLPMDPFMTESEVGAVAEGVASFLRIGRNGTVA